MGLILGAIGCLGSLGAGEKPDKSSLRLTTYDLEHPPFPAPLINGQAKIRQVTTTVKFDPCTTVLLLIDAWDSHPYLDFQSKAERVMKERLAPLVTHARRLGIQVVHAPHQRPISRYISVTSEDWDLDKLGINTTEAWYQQLKRTGKKTILVAGFASNICLVSRAVAPYQLNTQYRGFTQILVEDASAAIDLPSSGSQTHAFMTELFQLTVGLTTTTDEVLKVQH